MKLRGELKKQVEASSSKEEARDAIAKAGMVLTDDELDQVAGGLAEEEWLLEYWKKPRSLSIYICENCNVQALEGSPDFPSDYYGGLGTCHICGKLTHWRVIPGQKD